MPLDTLGDYKILDRLGEGGIGEVFRARDTRHGRTVAIKLVRDDLIADPRQRERFVADARAAARVSHPNIAALFDVCEQPDRVFIVFEYVAGDRLDALVSGTPLNARRAVDLGLQLADALAEAHAGGVLHRDLRPDNVIVTRKGQAKLLDTGLAAWTRGGAARQGASGQVAAHAATALATAPYLAPEQALGMTGDERTDVYCLGAILYETIAGRPPFAGANPVDVTLQVVQAAPVPPTRLNAAVPPDLEALVLSMLSKSPSGRPLSAALVSAKLREIAADMDARVADAAAHASMAAPSAAQNFRSASVGVAQGPGSATTDGGAWRWWLAAAVVMASILFWLWSR